MSAIRIDPVPDFLEDEMDRELDRLLGVAGSEEPLLGMPWDSSRDRVAADHRLIPQLGASRRKTLLT